jgi:hypothetical protein
MAITTQRKLNGPAVGFFMLAAARMQVVRLILATLLGIGLYRLVTQQR